MGRAGRVLLGVFVWFCFFKVPATLSRDDHPVSWEAVLSFAAAHGLQWGKDVVFTYGPLGYLNSDHYWGALFWPAWFWSAGFASLWTWAFLLFWRRLFVPIRVLLLAALPFLALCPGSSLGFEAVHFLAIGALGLACFPEERPGPGRMVIAGVALGILSLIKFTFLGYGVLTVGTLFVGWILAGQHLGNIPVSLRYSLEIASGYSSAMPGCSESMGLIGQGLVGWGGVILGGCVLVLALVCWRSAREWWPMGARVSLAGAGLFLAWKEGYVRVDEHVGVFLRYAFLTAALLPGLLRVRLEIQRLVRGKYRAYAMSSAALRDGSSTWSLRLRVKQMGSFRIRVRHDDGDHFFGVSSYRKFTVR